MINFLVERIADIDFNISYKLQGNKLNADLHVSWGKEKSVHTFEHTWQRRYSKLLENVLLTQRELDSIVLLIISGNGEKKFKDNKLF